MHVYHERQLGALCGVHCVNNLLQCPRFGPGDFAEIGVRLDQKERRLLCGIEPEDSAHAGANVDSGADGGNFSIQVLRIALARAGLKLTPAEHPDARALMAQGFSQCVGAYVVQRRAHWYALRAVGPCWWDLDSTLEFPRPLEDSQLTSRLKRLMQRGHHVFLVSGSLPHPNVEAGITVDSHWHEISSLLMAQTEDASRSPPESMRLSPSTSTEHACDWLTELPPPEVRAALALTGGDRGSAVDIALKARAATAKYVAGKPARLGKALVAAVNSIVQARYSLSDAIARLVALLCEPPSEKLAAAASLVDCEGLAHKLLTACSRKAKGWIWTAGMAQAATVAVDLLLALPAATSPESPEESSESSTSEDDAITDVNRPQCTSCDCKSPQQRNEEIEARKLRRNEEFDALDSLLGAVEVEGRLAQPLVSALGLRVCRLQRGVVNVLPVAERRRLSQLAA